MVPGLPSISLFLHYSQTSTVHPLTLCLGSGMFPFHFHRELHVAIQSRWDAHHPARLLWNPNVKEINVIKLLQMLFDI